MKYRRKFVYETICYVCIALAIAIKNQIVMANAIPEKYKFRRQAWGTGTQIKQEFLRRDRQIYEDYLAGSKTEELALVNTICQRKAYSVF